MTEEGEVWKWISGYENKYKISSYGNIYSELSKRFLKPNKHNSGYCVIKLQNNERKTFMIHRLVAESFIGKIPKGQVVDHIDRNKKNNHVTNLRITTYSENNLNKPPTLTHAKSLEKAIVKCNENNNIIEEYDSFNKALSSIVAKSSRNGLSKALKTGELYKGYIWRYKETHHVGFKAIKMIDGISYNNYEINELGIIRTLSYKKIMTPTQQGECLKYYIVTLVDIEGKRHPHRLHRILMSVFKPINNMENMVVNHIDKNTLNNKLDNLEWVTQKQNVIYSCGKKVAKVDIKTNAVLTIYNDLHSAFQDIGKEYGSNIRNVCNGQRKSAYGYSWKWVE